MIIFQTRKFVYEGSQHQPTKAGSFAVRFYIFYYAYLSEFPNKLLERQMGINLRKYNITTNGNIK